MSHPAGPTNDRPAESPDPRQASSFSTVGGLIALVFVVAMLMALLRSPHESKLPTLLILVACVVGIPWIIGPITLKNSHWMSLDARPDPFDPESDDVPPAARDAVLGVVPRLEAIGFHSLGHFRLDGTIPNITAYITLLENRSARRGARILTTIVAKSPNPIFSGGVTSLIFTTHFSDGTRLVTGNNLLGRLQPSPRNRHGSRSFPWIRDPFRLHDIHAACLARYASDGIPVAAMISEPVDHLRTTRDDELAEMVEAGHYYLDESRGQYRLTWKGAILGAWMLLWPVKPIRQALRRRAALRVLRELELAQSTDAA